MGDSGLFLLSARVIPLSTNRTPLGGGVLLCVSTFAVGYPRPMSVLNKRNAVLGWAVWNVSKLVAKQKAKSTVSTDGSRRPTKAVASGLAALGGAVWFWRRRQDDSDES